MDDKQQLLNTILTDIPISVALGFHIKELTTKSICTQAPLANNINVHQTAFAGSLYSICALTGWALITYYLQYQEFNSSLVVKDGKIHYLGPVATDIEAYCNLDNDAIEHFNKHFLAKGRGRMTAKVIIKNDDKLAVEFFGEFVAIKE